MAIRGSLDLNLNLGFAQLNDFKEEIMASFQDVKDMVVGVADTLVEVSTGVDRVSQEIIDLKAQIEAGGVVTQAQLDDLNGTAQTAKDRVIAVRDKVAAL